MSEGTALEWAIEAATEMVADERKKRERLEAFIDQITNIWLPDPQGFGREIYFDRRGAGYDDVTWSDSDGEHTTYPSMLAAVYAYLDKAEKSEQVTSESQPKENEDSKIN